VREGRREFSRGAVSIVAVWSDHGRSGHLDMISILIKRGGGAPNWRAGICRKRRAVIAGRCEASNPESRVPGLVANAHPGMTVDGLLRRRFLAMTKSILEGAGFIFSPQQAASHLAAVAEHLRLLRQRRRRATAGQDHQPGRKDRAAR